MSLRSKNYEINIKPIPWTRAGLHEKRFFDKQTREKLAYGLILSKQHGTDPQFEGPLLIDIQFHMKIPALIKYREKHGYHYHRPDLDNLIKFVLDTINNVGCIWKDDGQVAQIISQKIFIKEPKLIITISELT